MDSMPPATTTSTVPAASESCANIAAFMPEPHILFTVVQPVASESPAPSAAWRAGAWPWPAGSTQPMRTSCTSSGFSLARSTAARMAAAPSSGAAKPFSSPWKAPMGVRAAATMTIGSGFMEHSFQLLDRFDGFSFQLCDQFGRGQRTRQRHGLPGPQRDEIRLAGLGRGLAQFSGDDVLRREGELRRVPRRHLRHEAVRQAARRLAGEFLGDARVVFARGGQGVLVRLRRAAFRAGDEGGAELGQLRAQ